MNPRLVPAQINISFSEATSEAEAYEGEYHKLIESDNSPINQWVKHAKARGDTHETDPVLLNLLVELHNKIDALERFIKHEEPSRVPLIMKGRIESIGFEHFNLDAPLLSVGVQYYGRVEMPIHPKRDIGIFFEALSPTLAAIVRTHERDEAEWATYLTSRERLLIREAKESKK
ncbi:MAG: hypothetical protein NTW78_02205 [Campylobacterales bacterium]|nr:hypothetical protein [Campylobacterales bacterium]